MTETDLKRKLTTIVVADIVAYSRHAANNEDWTIRSLAEIRQITDNIIDQHNGRIFNTGGDSIFAEFNSPVNAVRSAVDFQEATRSRNLLQPPERQLRFRIGINLGDVMVQGNDLLGDGVNVAARIQNLAEPGGICVSGTVWDHIQGKVLIDYVDLGEQFLKNIPRPVRAYQLRVGSTDVRSEEQKIPHITSTQDKRSLKSSNRIIATVAVMGFAFLVITAFALLWYWKPIHTTASAANGNISLDALKNIEFVVKANPQERDRAIEIIKSVLRKTDKSERPLRKAAIDTLVAITSGNLRSVLAGELRRADLVGVNFEGADLYRMDFYNAFLILSDFRKANLTDANFSKAYLRGVKLSDAVLSGTNLADADWYNAFGITLEQLRNVNSVGLLRCPSGSFPQAFIDDINAKYGIKYEAYPSDHQSALRVAWAAYMFPGGACDYASSR